MLYFVARNAHGRPTLMHARGDSYSYSLCGLYVAGWSKKFFVDPIDAILCLKCKKAVNR